MVTTHSLALALASTAAVEQVFLTVAQSILAMVPTPSLVLVRVPTLAA
jgi:hypothetical protein